MLNSWDNTKPDKQEFPKRVQRVGISIGNVGLFRRILVKPVFPLFFVTSNLRVNKFALMKLWTSVK